MIPLSAVVITKNEAHNIGDCLDSLAAVCEEIVVMDAFSTDRTPEICKQKHVRFFQRAFDGFAAQKRAALARTTHTYVLALDADERISERLVDSILRIKKTGAQHTGYQMRRLSFYKKRPIRTCGWYPNPQMRLWDKRCGDWTNHLVHEYIQLESGSSCGMLAGDLLHYAYQSPAHMQHKALQYSDLYAAEHRFRKRISPIGTALKARFAFWRPYLLQGGFREGYVGLLIAWAASDGTFYKYIKLMEANRMLACSLIITTYNRPDALKEVLDSLRRQSLLPVEVIVAEDGADERTRQLIATEKSTFPVPLRHCTQEDKGFRLSRSRNRALSVAQGEYIVLIDGDMVLHRHFLRDQQLYCRKGWLLQSSRVLLNKTQTERVLARGWAQLSPWRRAWMRGLKGLYLPMFTWLFSKRVAGIYGLRACMISFWKEDAYAINGFDEAYQGWGREDNDFFARIQQYGVRIKKLKLSSIGYHLHHKQASRKELSQNEALLSACVAEKRTQCEKGLHIHLHKPTADV